MAFMLEAALEGLSDFNRCLILTHYNPDPDAIASAAGLQALLEAKTGLQITRGYSGVIGRAENRAMVKLLKMGMVRVREQDFCHYDLIALVDTQPGTGNNALPDEHKAHIVIDHHPRTLPELNSRWLDIREEAGSTTSIVYSYLIEAKVEIEQLLATGMLYGIITDTMDLGRGATEAEFAAYLNLLPRSDLARLASIRHPELPIGYYRVLAASLEESMLHEGGLVTLVLDQMPYPELPAEMADLLARAEGIRISFCAGFFSGAIFLSMRTKGGINAGKLIKKVVQGRGKAGGHGFMAGGMIEYVQKDEAREICEKMVTRLARILGITASPRGMLEAS